MIYDHWPETLCRTVVMETVQKKSVEGGGGGDQPFSHPRIYKVVKHLPLGANLLSTF